MASFSGRNRVSFFFEGNTYTGYIVSSTNIVPHFHWFMFEDQRVIAQYGDSIAFKIENGELMPMYHLTAPEFVSAVKECIAKYLEDHPG